MGSFLVIQLTIDAMPRAVFPICIGFHAEYLVSYYQNLPENPVRKDLA